MNSVRVIYCQECMTELFSYGEIVLQIFQDACEDYCFHDIMPEIHFTVYSDTKKIPVIEFLEKKGFVVSTESGQYSMQYKPRGLHLDIRDSIMECIICRDGDQHL